MVMNFNNYTQKSLEAVQSAQKLAQQNGHQQLEQVHLLLLDTCSEANLDAQLTHHTNRHLLNYHLDLRG